jgi:acetyltransferase-like isoleucine patch superfamily enzyme
MPYTVIDDYVMASVSTNIAHHTHVRKGCFFSHGVNIGAFTDIGNKAYISAGATVILKVKIGKSSLVGAGAVVIKDTPDYSIVAGVPAKELKTKE